MRCIFAWLIVLSLLVYGAGHAGVYNYTWKDEQGVLNITDYPPSEGVEILDIRPVPRQQVKRHARPPEAARAADAQKSRRLLEGQAARYRAEEAAARHEAVSLLREAQHLRSRSAIRKVKRKYRRWAAVMESEARQLVHRADALAKKAEKLEMEAAALP
ncbi:MAG TPA: DUF4124 domain-containing protein [Desulfobacteraceae bacterium]|nr:DUF4124 domain-containing protein [Desulfobacteraceae bacterium]